jgi:hypothetical protein
MMAKALLRLAFALGLLGALAWAWVMPWSRIPRGENDFLQLYVGAKLAGTSALYDAAAQETLQRQYVAKNFPTVLCNRLPFYVWLLKPFTALPYRAAEWAWQALMLGCFAAFVILHRQQEPWLPALAVMSVAWYTSVLNGQDVALVLLLAALAVRQARAGRDVPAGLLVAACAIKFHFFVFVPVALFGAKRWKMLAAAAAGVTAELLLSFAVQGPDWPREYIRFLLSPNARPAPYTLPNLRGLAMAWEMPGWLESLLLVLTVASFLALLARARMSFRTRMAFAIVGGLLVSHHAFIQDCLLLMVVLAWVGRRSPLRVPVALLLTPLPYYLLLSEGWPGGLFALALLALPVIWLIRGGRRRAVIFSPTA